MAVTLTELRNEIDQADSLTGWTGHDTLGTTDPVPIESTGWVGANVGAEIFAGYHTITSTDLSDAVIYAWVFSRLSLGDTADTNGGLMVMLADSTPDRIGYKVNGADKAAFRHDTGPTGWQCPALDTTSLPASPYVSAGAAANIDLTAIVEVGTIVNSLVAAPGMNPTYNVDIMRWLDPTANNGCAADIVGGTSGDPGTFSEIAAADRSTGNQQAHGLVRELAAGAFGCQGPLRFGNATGTSASWFEDSNATFVFEDRGFRTDLYKIFITDNGTGTTTFRLHGCALIAPTGVGAEFDADTDTDVTDVVIDTGSRISGFTNGVGLQSGHTFTGTITGSGQVRANGATMNGSSVLQSTVAANSSSLLWNVNTNPNGLLDNMTFDKTSGTAHHAIEFGTLVPAAMTLTGCAFGTDFSLTEGGTTGDETFHFRDTAGTITLTLTDCSGNFGYRTDGATIVIVTGAVSVTVTTVDSAGDPIASAYVHLRASDNTGPFPYLDNVTISRSGTLATVTHTAHGMATGDKVYLRGITDKTEDLGVHQITVTTANAYTFTTTDAGSTSYTGRAYVVEGQDETSYDNSPTSEGSFSGGTGHAVNDVLTLSKNIFVTVDAVSSGVVTQFTVDSSEQTGSAAATDVLTQSLTTGTGVDFSLTLDTDNVETVIRSTFVALDGTTNGSGVLTTSRVYSTDQPVAGWSRKSTASPYYKQGTIASTVDTADGLNFTAVMVSDE